MQHLRKLTVIVALLVALIVLALPAAAQPVTYSVTITEADFNAAFAEALANTGSPYQDLYWVYAVDHEDQIEVTGLITGPNGNTFSIIAVIVASVEDGRLSWILIESVVSPVDTEGESERPPRDDRLDQLGERAGRQLAIAGRAVLFDLLRAEIDLDETSSRFVFESITITENELTVTGTVQERNPNLPDLDVVELDDGNLQVTLTESETNAALAVLAERSERINSFVVDYGPMQVTLTTSFTTSDGQAIDATVVLVPDVQPDLDGVRTPNWTVTSVTVNGEEVPAGGELADRVRENGIRTWQRFTRLQTRNLEVLDITVTEDALIYVLLPVDVE